MALPINKTPIYNLTIPSTGESVDYRPFLVKDEKALLLAQNSEDPVVMITTLKDVIRGCLDSKIDVDTLATFDIEYIFAQLRAKSVDENVNLVFTCGHCDKEDNKVKVTIDLTKLKVEKDPEHTPTIILYDNVGVKLRYPDIEMIRKIDELKDVDMAQIFDVIISCIDFIYDDEQMYYAKDSTKAELMQFLENLTSDQFGRIQKFFETMPKIQEVVEFDCPACAAHNKTTLQGINSFF
jgi:hypothetical protein